MTRLALAVLGIALLAGCGGSSVPGSRACRPGEAPPAPVIEAHRTSDRIRVEYEVPAGCEADAILVTANSVDKLDNIAPPPGGGGPIRLRGDKGVVQLKLPPLDLPPYVARASTMTRLGRRSETISVLVPETGTYCRRTQSAAVCIRRAQAKFMRCLRGNAPRAKCPDYVWRARPLIPYEPLRGVTRVGLTRSFAFMAHRAGGDPRFDSIICRSIRSCVATWRGNGKVFRVRYAVSGYGQRPGCWIAERRAILKETPPDHPNVTPLRYVISDRHSGCVDWVQ